MPEYPSPRTLIFGAGAIGTYLGCSFFDCGASIVFVEKPAVAAELRERGILLSTPQKDLQIEKPTVVGSIEEALEKGPYDISLFALKSFDTKPAIESLSPFKNQLPPILCLQNGVENEELISIGLNGIEVIAGTVTSALLRKSTGEVVLERQRGIGISAGHPISHHLCDFMNMAGLNARLYPRPQDMKWSKLITNLLVNATSAILDLAPSEVLASHELYRLEVAQINETLAVMRAQGIHVTDLPATPVRLLVFGLTRLPPWLSRPLLRRFLGSGRGAKMPSLYLDLQSGRKSSEVEYLNGAVVRYGHKLGIPTPANQLLCQTLLQLVRGELSWELFRRQPEQLISRWIH